MRHAIINWIRTNSLLAGSAGLGVLLLLTAVLQYRWINRVSEADQQQRGLLLETTLRNFTGEFERSLRDTLQSFRGSLGVAPGTDWEAQLNTAVARWQTDPSHAPLLSAVSLATLDATGAAEFRRRPLDSATFRTQAWPASLTSYRTMLEKRLRTSVGELPLTPRDYIQEFADGQPVLVFQLVEDPHRAQELANEAATNEPDAVRPRRRGAGQRSLEGLLETLAPTTPNQQRQQPELAGWCFLELDTQYLQTRFLPEQFERYFRQRGMEGFQLALLTGLPPQALYLSDPHLTAQDFTTADAAVPLLARRLQNMQEAGRPPNPPPVPPRPLREPANGQEAPRPPRNGPPRPGRRLLEEFAAFDAAVDPTAWRLVVRDAHGSLEAALNQARLRNLTLGFSVLLILAASVVLLVLAAQRVRRLAHQQLEFVAGVSHELRTPLSVIQSTSHNLAQGLVKDPQRVRQYGAAIQTEVRRLSNQVEQMLAFAGIQSGRKLYELQPVNLTELCARALAEDSAALTGWQVEGELLAELPLVLADEQALESAIKNLLHNAQKYAASGRWLRLSAQTSKTKTRPEVQLTIADHGPGIPAEDLPHIFEPFYRSRSVVATTIPGAGLGLNLVQRHLAAMGGRVTVQTTIGAGTAFTLHLPVAPEPTAAGNAFVVPP